MVAVLGNEGGKASIVVGLGEAAKGQADAVALVRAAAAAVGGKGGGGRPEMAQAGGPDGAALGAAIEAIRTTLQS